MRARHPLLRLASGVALLLIAGGPAAAGKKDMEILQSDVDQLQRDIYDLKRLVERQTADMERLLALLDGGPESVEARARLNANVDSLRVDVRSLGGRFDETSERIGSLERRLDECLRARATAPSIPSSLPGEEPGVGVEGSEGMLPTPSAGTGQASLPDIDAGKALFQQAYGDYVKDNFNLAISEFREYVQLYPGSNVADNAQYWVAMSFFNQRKFDEAVRELDLMLARFPRADNAPEALYRKGLALRELNRLGQAVLIFNDVVSRYPETPAATQASERLRELAAGGR